MTRLFMRLGAWVYANSNPVIETMTSAPVIKAKASTCQPRPGLAPAAICVSNQAGMRKQVAVRNKPKPILRNGVSLKTRLIAG